MKILRNLAIAVFTTLMSTACGGGTPESVAESYVEAFLNADYKKAAKLATKEYAAEILEEVKDVPAEVIKQVIKQVVEERKAEYKGIKYKIIDTDIGKKGATVRFEFTLNGETDTGRVDLVKEGGSWKVEGESLYLAF
ncbi:MAG: DUF4878 domain-containing protein [Prevotellaceae bacterium]|jgi:ABC-type transporter MlaC component|nr:DUF4878 domain-containing protein [Prevotellaceae bacterium]